MGVPAHLIDKRGAYTPTSNSSPQGGGEHACCKSAAPRDRSVLSGLPRYPLPLAGRVRVGVPAHLIDKRGAYTPTSNSSPQGGGERACANGAPRDDRSRAASRAIPSPLRGGPGWGCRRTSSISVAPTPPPPTPPRKGEESTPLPPPVIPGATCVHVDRLRVPLRGPGLTRLRLAYRKLVACTHHPSCKLAKRPRGGACRFIVLVDTEHGRP